VEDAENIEGAARLFAAKALVIEAESFENIITVVVRGSGAGIAGVAGSVAVKVLNSTTQAYIGDYALINQSGIPAADQTVIVRASNQVVSVGTAGTVAGAGAAGVGAVADITVIRNLVGAHIGNYARVKAAGDISITAECDKYVNSLTTAVSGGVAGVAGAVSVIVINDLFSQDVKDALTDATEDGDGTDTASSVDDQIEGDYISKLGDSEHVGQVKNTVEGKQNSLQISSYLNETSVEALKSTRAFIGVGAQVDADGNLTVKAQDDTTLIAAGLAGSVVESVFPA
jgi:hypothetical protein